MLSHFSHFWLFATVWLPTSLLCPWDSLSKNTGVGCRALLQEIFPTQGLKPGLPHYKRILYHVSHQGSPKNIRYNTKKCIRGSNAIPAWRAGEGQSEGRKISVYPDFKTIANLKMLFTQPPSKHIYVLSHLALYIFFNPAQAWIYLQCVRLRRIQRFVRYSPYFHAFINFSML